MPTKRYPFEQSGPIRLEVSIAPKASYDWVIKVDKAGNTLDCFYASHPRRAAGLAG